MATMHVFATNLVRISVITGSMIRMELYANIGEDMATYVFEQDVKGAAVEIEKLLNKSATLPAIDRRTAPDSIQELGTMGKHTNQLILNDRESIDEFTGGSATTPAVLKFLGQAHNSFTANLKILVGGKLYDVLPFRFRGKLDASAFDVAIPGTLAIWPGRWQHLIDI